MNNAILMSSGADNIDFMIHGIFSYEIFGHTVWITTSRLHSDCAAADVGAGDRGKSDDETCKGNSGGLSKCSGDHGRETGCDGIWNNGKSCGAEIRELHQHDFCVYTYEQYFRFVRVETADCRLRHNAGVRSHHICSHPYHAVQESAA